MMATLPPGLDEPEMMDEEEPLLLEEEEPLDIEMEDAVQSTPPEELLTDPKAAATSAVECTDEEKTALALVLKEMALPDDEIREKMLPIWQMYENYWRGLQNVIYDPSSNSFRDAAGVLRAAGELEDTYIGSKIVNTYRAHGESIASAISAGTPVVTFYPEDADDPQDVTTAKTYTTASEFIADDNESRLLHLKAIYTRWNQPFVAYYNTYVYDEKYGTISKKSYTYEEEERQESYCPSCGEDLPVQAMNGNMAPMCPYCGIEGIQSSSMEIVPKLAGVEEIPKGREKIEIYGPRHVRVPYNVKSIEQCGYLILETEHHWTDLASLFPHVAEDILAGGPATDQTSNAARLARTAAEGGDTDRDQRTLKRSWLRPCTYHLIPDESVRGAIKAKFPKGVQLTLVDDIFVEAFAESMDDHWTLVPDPFAEHIHGDPYGKPMIPIQDMTNDTVQLTFETILFSIPDRFADPRVLNFDKYNDTEKAPGNVFPAVRPQGMGLNAGFFDGHAAVLSDNVEVFRQSLETYAQFVTGDTPGIHGGPLPKGSSRTADEYRQAKQSALQRLSILWYLVNVAWSHVMKKAVNELRENMRMQGEDLKFVKEQGKGFTNVWIRLSDIDDGNVGRVRAENSETFPLTTEQKRGALIELLQTNIPQLFQWLLAPENIGEMSRIMIGMNNFKIPGEEQREQQLWEINNILTGQMVEVDPMVDDHASHASTIQSWAASEDGRKTKQVNPMGYQMVMEHLQIHMMIAQQQMMAQLAAQGAPAPGVKPAPQGGQAQASGASAPTGPMGG